MLGALRAAGLQLVIITNGHHEIQRTKLWHCSAADAFAHIIVGGEEVRSETWKQVYFLTYISIKVITLEYSGSHIQVLGCHWLHLGNH